MDAGYPRPEGAPVLFLLPEFSLRPSEVGKFAEIVRKSAENTVFVSGAGHLTRGEALSIESGAEKVWEPGSEHPYTNCALIGFGGSKVLRLQLKIVPSWEERDRQAPGRVVRYFVGHQFQFIVVICSELLNRPQERTTIESVIAQLDDQGKRLNLVVWIQHNPDPRSDAFGQSILRLERPPYCPTVLVVSTRNTRSSRLTNFAVSGAIVPSRRLINARISFRYNSSDWLIGSVEEAADAG